MDRRAAVARQVSTAATVAETTEPRVMLAAATLTVQAEAFARVPYEGSDESPYIENGRTTALWISNFDFFESHYVSPFEFDTTAIGNDELSSATLEFDVTGAAYQGFFTDRIQYPDIASLDAIDAPSTDVEVYAFVGDGSIQLSDTDRTTLVGTGVISELGLQSIDLDVAALNAARDGDEAIGLVVWPADNADPELRLYVEPAAGRAEAFDPVLRVERIPFNDPPVVEPHFVTMSEGGVFTGQLAISDPDPFSSVFVTGDSTPDITRGGIFQANSDGFFEYRPGRFNGVTRYEFTVSDGTNEVSSFVEFNVTPVASPPEFTTPFINVPTVEEDGRVRTTVFFRDFDFEDSDFSVENFSLNEVDRFGFSDDGSIENVVFSESPNGFGLFQADFDYVPDADFSGETSLWLQIDDGTGNVSGIAGDSRITITEVNDPPVAGDLSFRTNEEQSLFEQVLATDVDDRELSYSIGTGPANGAASIQNARTGTFAYTPLRNFNGVDSFTVLVSDGEDVTEVTVTVTVDPVNDRPQIIPADEFVTIAEDTAFEVSLRAFDIDSPSEDLSVEIVSAPNNGTVEAGNFRDDDASVFSLFDFTYTPDENYFTPGQSFSSADSVTFRVTDGDGFSNDQTFTILVTSVNDRPVSEPTAIELVEGDGPNTGQLIATDIDSSNLVFDLISAPDGLTNFSFNSNGSFSYEFFENFNGVTRLEYTVSDRNLAASSFVEFRIESVDDVPVLRDQTDQSLSEDTRRTVGTFFTDGDLLDADFDISEFTLRHVTAGSDNVVIENVQFEAGTATMPSNRLTFDIVPDAEFNGVTEVGIAVVDGEGNESETKFLTVRVLPVNDPPVLDEVDLTAGQGDVLTGTLTATDIDDDIEDLRFAPFVATSAAGRLEVSEDGSYVYEVATDYTGRVQTIIAVEDADGAVGSSSFFLTVEDREFAPVADDLTVSGDEDTAITGTVVATDADGDDLTFLLLSGPANGSVTVNDDGTFSYQGRFNFNGADRFTVEVTDGERSDTATVDVTVNPVNDAPNFGRTTVTRPEDTVVAFDLFATDVDGDDLKFSLASEPVGGTVDLTEDGFITFTPDANFNGIGSVMVSVTDGELTDTDEVLFFITPVNDAPEADDQSITVDEDTTVEGIVAADDVDGDDLTFRLADGPDNGSVTVGDDGTFSYTGDADFNGTDSFTVTVSDGELTDTATVSVTVDAVNDAPVADDASLAVDENSAAGTVVGTVSASDIEGDDLAFAITGGNEDGQFTIDAATGVLSVAAGASLDFETVSSYSLTVSATETSTGERLSDEAIVAIAINDVAENDGPLEIGLDIDPGDSRNRVSVLRDRWLRVALTGGDDFDVRDIDLDSVSFGVDGDETGAAQNRRGRFYGFYTDVNDDGVRDLVLFFDLYQTGIFDDGLRFGSFDLTLRGNLDDGSEFVGQDTLELTLFRS